VQKTGFEIVGDDSQRANGQAALQRLFFYCIDCVGSTVTRWNLSSPSMSIPIVQNDASTQQLTASIGSDS
jgi:hypothetical protein